MVAPALPHIRRRFAVQIAQLCTDHDRHVRDAEVADHGQLLARGVVVVIIIDHALGEIDIDRGAVVEAAHPRLVGGDFAVEAVGLEHRRSGNVDVAKGKDARAAAGMRDPDLGILCYNVRQVVKYILVKARLLVGDLTVRADVRLEHLFCIGLLHGL